MLRQPVSRQQEDEEEEEEGRRSRENELLCRTIHVLPIVSQVHLTLLASHASDACSTRTRFSQSGAGDSCLCMSTFVPRFLNCCVCTSLYMFSLFSFRSCGCESADAGFFMHLTVRGMCTSQRLAMVRAVAGAGAADQSPQEVTASRDGHNRGPNWERLCV